MAEAHPVGFQWVMEAKRRGATIIHVDPRFTRTSAVSDVHVPIRAGLRHRLPRRPGQPRAVSNELDFREYVVAYTNAAQHHRRGLPGHRGPRRTVLRASTPRPATTTRPPGTTSRRRTRTPRSRRASRRCSATSGEQESQGSGSKESHQAARSESHGSGGAPVSWKGRRDETLQDPHCVFQILKRHFARYTPEMVQEVCGITPEQFAAGGRRPDPQQRPRAHQRLLLRRRLDPPQRRGADDPDGRDPAAPARQHRPARRRHHGAARPRQHPGLDRHPDAVQHPARLPADAARRASTRRSTTGCEDDEGKAGFWGNVRSYAVSLLKSYWGDAATAENDFCFDYLPRIDRRPLHLHHGEGADRGPVQGLLPGRGEPRGRLGQRQDAAARAGEPRLARRARPRR